MPFRLQYNTRSPPLRPPGLVSKCPQCYPATNDHHWPHLTPTHHSSLACFVTILWSRLNKHQDSTIQTCQPCGRLLQGQQSLHGHSPLPNIHLQHAETKISLNTCGSHLQLVNACICNSKSYHNQIKPWFHSLAVSVGQIIPKKVSMTLRQLTNDLVRWTLDTTTKRVVPRVDDGYCLQRQIHPPSSWELMNYIWIVSVLLNATFLWHTTFFQYCTTFISSTTSYSIFWQRTTILYLATHYNFRLRESQCATVCVPSGWLQYAQLPRSIRDYYLLASKCVIYQMWSLSLFAG